MSVQDNKHLVTRYFKESMTSGLQADLTGKSFDSKSVYHLPSGDMDYARMKQISEELRTAFPDLTTSIDDIIAEGDKVVVRYTMKGTHKGIYRGIPGTGKKFTQVGIGIYRIKDGKFPEIWMVNDTLGLMLQVGAIPAGSIK
jgi:predicted ester cyclase